MFLYLYSFFTSAVSLFVGVGQEAKVECETDIVEGKVCHLRKEHCSCGYLCLFFIYLYFIFTYLSRRLSFYPKNVLWSSVVTVSRTGT